MHFLWKLILKVAANSVALFALTQFFNDFIIFGGWKSIVIAAIVLALLNIFVRPILKFITFPIILLTFGLFNIILYIVILYTADALTASLAIGSLSTLFWASLVLGIINSLI